MPRCLMVSYKFTLVDRLGFGVRQEPEPALRLRGGRQLRFSRHREALPNGSGLSGRDVPTMAGVHHGYGEDAVFDAATNAILPVRIRHSGRAVSFPAGGSSARSSMAASMRRLASGGSLRIARAATGRIWTSSQGIGVSPSRSVSSQSGVDGADVCEVVGSKSFLSCAESITATTGRLRRVR